MCRNSFRLLLLILIFSVTSVSAQDLPTEDPVVQEVSGEEKTPAEPAQALSSQETKVIKAIEVRGNNTVTVSTILFKIKSRVGQEYLQNVISDDLKRLYNTGYFSDVSVDREAYEDGFKVIFFVVEKPLVDKITFSKLKYLRPKAVLKKLRTQKGKFLDRKLLNDDVRTIEELYAKKGLSKVEINVEQSVDELTNKATVHFVIKEGTRVKVTKISVAGNKAFPRKRILKVIKTRRSSLFSSGYLKEDILKEDMARVKAFYEREGYIDATAQYQLEKIRESRLAARITIEEGRQYFVEKIDFAGNTIFTEDELMAAMAEIKTGKVFSRERLSVDLSNIRVKYFDAGYIFANVKESTALNPKTGEVEVKLDVQEGDLAYINEIKIHGNERTRDIVIRRELRLYPGDKFDGGKLRRSKQRLTNLGYFDEVSYDIEDTKVDNQKDLVVQVKEAKTGSFSFGGGYSTVEQFIGFVEIEQKNFDFTNWPTFTGGGQQLSLRAETGSTRQNTRLSFTEPWLFDYPISGGFDAYITERDKERDVGYAYDEKRVGGNLRLGKQFTEYWSGGLGYRREKIKVGNFDDDVSTDLLAEEGTNTVSSVNLNAARDKRDNVFSPTQGSYISQSVDLAGGLFGGTKDFYRLTTKGSYYIPLMWKSVIEIQARAGVVEAYGDSEKVPIFERFFAGGARTIRGYDERKVGPIDSVTSDPIGGESMLVGNVEYTIPIIEFVKIAAFFDVGNVWSKVKDLGSGGFKSGTGLGLRVKTPIGPVNLDYGYPLNDEPGEESRSGKFYFSISRGF